MRIPIKSLFLCLLMVILVSGLAFGLVAAQNPPMTDAQIGRIRSSCFSAKNTLNQLHASDALLRVNRGQIYESMSTKLMLRFDSRADSNHLDSKVLTSVASSYASAITTFREDYKNYEVQLANSLAIDCLKEPVSFYDAIATARTKRSLAHADVVKLNGEIDNYKAALDSFETNFKKFSGVNQ